ncbi:cyclic nucleotide-binding/CBS domain-containing protein [Massilia jejuensis]|uniref:Cyclic nucleotide-binding/CBS domain-containing protein n=1 Tax=Massilia jejuensis TaxID=648894 RepID=A0ABW0PGI9_9BURK
MSKPIASIMRTQATTVAMDATLAQVEDTLRLHHLSAVPVIERPRGAVLGIISARDLAQAHHDKRKAGEVRAWEICSYKPVEVDPSASLSEVARLMVARDIHHVLVTDNKAIVGIVSALDFVRQFIEEDTGNPS